MCIRDRVNRVFPTETLEADTLWFARQLAGMPDASIHLTKNIMNALADGNLEEMCIRDSG